MNKVLTPERVNGPGHVEPQVLGRAPAPGLGFSGLRLPLICDETRTLNPDFNAT
jgi:hypothetical protein